MFTMGTLKNPIPPTMLDDAFTMGMLMEHTTLKKETIYHLIIRTKVGRKSCH